MSIENAPRRRLRNRRQCETFEFRHGQFRFAASLGRFDDGALAEVFLVGPKVGTDIAAAASDAAIVASIALQFGAPVETIRHALARNSDGTAAGPLGALLDLLAAKKAVAVESAS